MLEIIVITTLLVSTLILALRKWGFFNWYQVHYGHIKYLPPADCYLCWSLWLSALYHFPMAGLWAFVGEWYSALVYFLVPFASASLSNWFINENIKP